MKQAFEEAFLLQEVYRDAYCQVSKAERIYGIYHYYHTLPQSRDYLENSMEAVLHQSAAWLQEGESVFYWLEVREGQFLPSEDVTWIRKDIVPQLIEAGIRYVAYVSSNNLFRHFSQETVVDKQHSKYLTLKVFQENEDVLHWLRTLKAAKP